MSEKAVFAFRKPTAKEIPEICNENTVIIAVNADAVFGLQDLNIHHLTLKTYFDKNEYENFYDRLINLAHSIGETVVGQAATLRTCLNCQGFDLWSLWEYHLAFELFPPFVLYELSRKIIREEDIKNIILLGNDDPLEAMIISAAKSERISSSISPAFYWMRFKKFAESTFNFFAETKYPCISLFKKFSCGMMNKNNTANGIIRLYAWFSNRIPSLIRTKEADSFLNNKKKVLLFSCFFFNDITQHLRSLLESSDSNDFLFTIVRADMVSRSCAKASRIRNVAYKIFSDYSDKGIEARIAALADDMYERVGKINLNNIKDEQGFPVKERVHHFFSTYFSKRNLRKIISFRLLAEAVIRDEKPDLVIMQEGRTAYGQLLSSAVLDKGIAHLVVQPQPSLFDYDIFWNMFFRKKEISGYIAVPSRLVEQQISKSADVTHNTIVNVGNPMFIQLVTGAFPKVTKEEIYARLHIDSKKEILVFASQRSLGGDKVHRLLINAMKELPNNHLVIKLHPVESPLRSSFSARRAELKNVTVAQDIDLWSLLDASRLLITVSSFVALEAMVLKKPVVIVGLNPYYSELRYIEPNPSPYVDAGAAVKVYDKKDLVPAIKSILNDSNKLDKLYENMKNLVADVFGQTDGMSNQRIIDLINSLLSGKTVEVNNRQTDYEYSWGK
ncbi:MAG: CDP-glycerol glycerophosphotransferase family protein [Candidatus Omnitrophica bacterium]|nr:CDP-glycerol glycerophosphotransferase family protein [Candidatus Omnitrophota bacterium]